MAGLAVAGLVHAPTENRRAAAGGCHRLDRRQAFTTPLRPPAEAPRLSTLISSLFAAAHLQVKAGIEALGPPATRAAGPWALGLESRMFTAAVRSPRHPIGESLPPWAAQ